MKEHRIAAHVYEVLSRSAGDLSWQAAGVTAACVPPPDLDGFERMEWFEMWDSAGPGRTKPSSWARIRRAIAVCNDCPLRTGCLAYAKDPRHRVEGVWGGFYFPAAGRTAVALPRVPLTPPGTKAA